MLKNQILISSLSGNKLEEFELIELAAKFFLRELNIITPVPKIKCNITISDAVMSESTGEHLCGEMYEKTTKSGKVTYHCTIADYINSIEFIKTLAHELIHVWQSATKRLQIIDNEWFWDGESYSTSPYNGTDDDYMLPWEQEADILDTRITKQFYLTYLGD